MFNVSTVSALASQIQIRIPNYLYGSGSGSGSELGYYLWRVLQRNLRKKFFFLLASWKPLTKRTGSGYGAGLGDRSGSRIRICDSVYESKDSDPSQNGLDPEHWFINIFLIIVPYMVQSFPKLFYGIPPERPNSTSFFTFVSRLGTVFG